MASLFDQYEQDFQQSTISNDKYLSADFEDGDEKPIFQKTKINLETPAPILHLAISNGQLVLIMTNNVLWRVDLHTQNRLQEVELSRIVPGVKLTGMYLNPSADHLLITFSTELLYLNRKFAKPKPSSKLKGHEITAVAWNASPDSNSNQTTTKPILLGTSRGIIFETEISADEGLFSSSIELYCKQVFDIGKGNPHAITGLQYWRVNRTDTYFVFVTTVTRIYQFIGRCSGPEDRPLLQPLFNKYLGLPEGFQEIPSTLNYSRLQLYTAPRQSTPSALGWLTQTGIFYAQIDPKNEEQLLSGTRMFHFPDDIAPLSFIITDFHILLLYPHHVGVLSSLTEPTSSPRLLFTDHYNEMYGQLLDVVRDGVTGTLWVYADRAIFRYKVTSEDRHVWQIYAEKGDYTMAKHYCKDNPRNMDKVLLRQAEAFFNNKQYKESALCYADTQASFEDIVLKFLQCQDAPIMDIKVAVKSFLKEKVRKVRSEDPARTTMLVLWVLELLLSELSELGTHDLPNRENLLLAQAELEEFVTDPYTMKCIRSNKKAVYDLIASHGDEANLLLLARLTEDYKRVIEHFIYKGDHLQALETLKEQSTADLWYQFSPDLVEAEPKATLSAIRCLLRPLDPVRLLPALIAAQNKQPDEVIKYLEYVTNELNCPVEAVHNFFLSLLAEHMPERLMVYLSIQGEEPGMVNYDLRYAVRVCREQDCREACVKLYSMLGLCEAALDLALTISLPLAISTVSQLSNARNLWLKIAEHVVKEKDDISQAMLFLKQSELKIEDILPFFPDFTTIDHFKDAICSSLQEYNQHIQDLKEEMEDATKSAEIIRNEIQSFRSKYSVILASDVCNLCDIQLLLRPFYTFPCNHRFHADCLCSETLQLLPEKKKDMRYIQRELELGMVTGGDRAGEMDALLASQCLYCGDLMIDLIDKPFIPEEDFEKVKKEWE